MSNDGYLDEAVLWWQQLALWIYAQVGTQCNWQQWSSAKRVYSGRPAHGHTLLYVYVPQCMRPCVRTFVLWHYIGFWSWLISMFNRQNGAHHWYDNSGISTTVQLNMLGRFKRNIHFLCNSYVSLEIIQNCSPYLFSSLIP